MFPKTMVAEDPDAERGRGSAEVQSSFIQLTEISPNSGQISNRVGKV